MAYSVPTQWAHGDVPTAALMNKYSDSLNAIEGWQGTYIQMAMQRASSETLYIVHKWRWLWYYTEAGQTTTIVDPAGVGDSVTLTDVVAMTVYDLSNVSWLTQGYVFNVTGAYYAIEDHEA